MHFIIYYTVCLPIRTGPSFTGIKRALYLKQQGHEITIYFPLLKYEWQQQKTYNRKFSKTEFMSYVIEQYSIPASIKVVLYDTIFVDFINIQQVINYNALYRSFNHSVKPYTNSILIIEDPEPLFMIDVAQLIMPQFYCLFYKVIAIHHTQFLNIARLTLNNYFFEQYCSKLQDHWKHPTLLSICISKAIQTQFKPNKSIVTRLVHGCHEKYFNIPFHSNVIENKIYYMGKLDCNHKCLPLMLEYILSTKEMIDIFGKGTDQSFVEKSNKFSYKGPSTDPINDLLNYKIYTSFSHLEGVCTATIEALLMHKKVILIDTDCNDIFKKYRNTYFFTTKEEFKRVLRQAITDPCIPRDPLLDDFKWENCNKVLYNEIHNIVNPDILRPLGLHGKIQ